MERTTTPPFVPGSRKKGRDDDDDDAELPSLLFWFDIICSVVMDEDIHSLLLWRHGWKLIIVECCERSRWALSFPRRVAMVLIWLLLALDGAHDRVVLEILLKATELWRVWPRRTRIRDVDAFIIWLMEWIEWVGRSADAEPKSRNEEWTTCMSRIFGSISIIFRRIDFRLFGSISICSDRFPSVRIDFHLFGSISICSARHETDVHLAIRRESVLKVSEYLYVHFSAKVWESSQMVVKCEREKVVRW